MDVTVSILQLNTPDGKMEATRRVRRTVWSYAGIVVLMQAFGLDEASAKDAWEKANHFSPNI